MIALYTNKPEYTNDMAEVVRAYLGFAEIEFVDAPLKANRNEPFDMNIIVDQARACAEATVLRAGGEPVLVSKEIKPAGEGASALYIKKQEKRAAKIAVFRALRQALPQSALPWGALTGIRPTKLFRELVEEKDKEFALQVFNEEFDVALDKTCLAAQIVDVQYPVLASLSEKDIDVYIGIPFCKSRCLYCSFASEVAGKDGVPQDYLRALHEDIAAGAEMVRQGGYSTRCLYIGGGTPTTLTIGQLEELFACVLGAYGGFTQEITVEAGRPDTVDKQKLACLRALGVTRISLNPQSMNAHTLARIGRAHAPEDIVRAYGEAREVGFTNINMDIIAGLPGESITDMEHTLDAIERMRPENLTVHTLAIKRSSRLKERMQEYPLPEAGEVERMLGMSADRARAMGMQPYYMYRQKYMRGNFENIGFALSGKECWYNIDMMEETVSILAHGAGAMSKRVFAGKEMRVERIPAPKDIRTYCEKLPRLLAEKDRLFL